MAGNANGANGDSCFKMCLSAAIEGIFPGEKMDFLSNEQIQAIQSFFFGNDTFVSLPTGHGKSLIFQLVVPIAKKMFELGKHDYTNCHQSRPVPAHPVVLVIAPLNSLIADQIESCKKKQMTACKLDDLPLSDDNCLCGATAGPAGAKFVEYDFIFTSPETLEQKLNVLSRIENQLLGVVVDESHCVINWGTAPNEKSPFRSSYSRVGNLRALVNVPILCLTATASSTTRKSIIKCLNMTNTKVIQLSPDKENMKYIVNKAHGEEIEETLSTG
ncbi:Werner syndrome ATP-dependent helicase-like [Dendronephthya gigantea]|uniref:Werner syndrome ATP-dependent helicase-like n=1 Tax=Dendronephthya gigantea TaxID=151771 RepID=UPI00106C22B6|nr:Werner syndrome ATP-dependent helicase-like [Dendronephthya gigantea]